MKPIDRLFTRTSLLPPNAPEPLTDLNRCNGDDLEEEEDEDSSYGDRLEVDESKESSSSAPPLKLTAVLREEEELQPPLLESRDSFSLRQSEHTPGGCWCFGCLRHRPSGLLGRPTGSLGLLKFAMRLNSFFSYYPFPSGVVRSCVGVGSLFIYRKAPVIVRT